MEEKMCSLYSKVVNLFYGNGRVSGSVLSQSSWDLAASLPRHPTAIDK